ncbi:sensor histidine kinase [Bacillus cereus]|uniref:sensor histidine kinase n=1 Tax=Bacillus cereus TaxID=1396 RepID=UPI000BF56DE1|nr:HAMP domain-containing sensor histidine kinase [Bacillus cereus]PEY47963.1 two-component sensor histidine kinase [Bacillus cereus]PFE39939.1 two-component sensor histidine kinase [Bacillus cereus]PFI67024.1 two-component sensor histidine kinase [Bacillus cereus]PFJ67300.1 two-component sensor histidine kinase [Bacillus cereus]PFK39185.1 two-component sensor histidine kinase [Bacillus cereus]
MKKGIVLKLFMLTTALCTLILVTIFIGQTIFFKQYYANRKVNDIKTNIQSFEKAYIKVGDDAKVIQELEQNFYQENATWITTLDSVGNIKYANDFSIEIQLDPNENKIFSERSIHIPLYSFINLEDIQRMKYSLEQGSHIIIDGVQKGDIVVPAMLTIKEKNVGLENKQLSERLYGPKAVSSKESSQLYLAGSIQNVQLPEGTVGTNFIYGNRVLIDRIKQFQVDLLLNQKSNDVTSTEIMDYEENDIKYKVLIKPTKDAGGKTNYIFAMTSLQPVDEAVQMIKDYYVYLIIFVLILIVLISFYYSKKIAKPLLQINDTTKKIAGLDFSETIPITTKDEIGDLSQNINTLSKALHSYIHQLQQDIEKEKQLENTRKEFIAGVSHELKTPLSIMKSCISILEDGVASNKKEYYFKAMSKEVDKMDMLIIDMLELANFESGTYKMEMDVFHIDEMIDYICEQLTSDITAKQLYVHKQLSKIEVVANQHRIEQVITNFITNAIRYTPEQENIIISTIEENERVKVCVENKGAHIAPEHLEKIWDRFYRGDTSRQRSKGGTGLGLAISKNILELHDAEYGVSNTEDGVLFYFYLNKNV